MAWEYVTDNVTMPDKWSDKKRQQAMHALMVGMNNRGRDNWELVSYQPMPLVGNFSGQINGYAYLMIWKRPAY